MSGDQGTPHLGNNWAMVEDAKVRALVKAAQVVLDAHAGPIVEISPADQAAMSDALDQALEPFEEMV